MKDKILMLVIGVLLGAIITAGCFMLFGNKRNPDLQKDGEFKRWKNGQYDKTRIKRRYTEVAMPIYKVK